MKKDSLHCRFCLCCCEGKTVHLPLPQYLISVSKRYEADYKRKETTGKNATSMLEDAILLSVAMLLLCAANHAYRLALHGVQAIKGKTNLIFLKENGCRDEETALKDC